MLTSPKRFIAPALPVRKRVAFGRPGDLRRKLLRETMTRGGTPTGDLAMWVTLERNAARRRRSSSNVTVVSIINSSQQVTLTIPAGQLSATATITSVNTANTVVYPNGLYQPNSFAGSDWGSVLARYALTNSTTITATRDHDATTPGDLILSLTVLEFKASAVSSVQIGTITLDGATTQLTNTATISSVDLTRSVVIPNGVLTTLNASTTQNSMVALTLTDATTVTADRLAGSFNCTAGFTVIQFASSIVRSVQQRTLSYTLSAATDNDTITAVDPSNTLLVFRGYASTNGSQSRVLSTLVLSSATNVASTRNTVSSGTIQARYTAIEFVPGVIKTMQRSTLPFPNTGDFQDNTITTVNAAKSLCNFCGLNSSSTTSININLNTCNLTSGINVRFQRGGGGVTTNLAIEVAEFN